MADIYTLIDRDGTPFQVMHFVPPEGRSRAVRILILPGANCNARRYRWLAEPLAREGATVFIPDPPVLAHPTPDDPTIKRDASYVSIDQMIKTLAMPWANDSTDDNDGLTFVIGHSLGGSILMEYLDPAQAMADPRSGVGAGYKPPVKIDGGVVVGATMQADVMGTKIKWRQNDTPLSKPDALPMLFVAGEADGLATPNKVQSTVARYKPPTAFVMQKGANHFGWAEGESDMDLRNLDGKADLDPAVQKDGLLRLIAGFFSAIADERPDTLQSVLQEIAAQADTITVR